MNVIDINVHPISREMVEDPRNLQFLEREGGTLLGNSLLNTLLNRMDAGGISKACLLGPNPCDGMTLTNEMVHRMVESSPGRFLGFVGVDPIGPGRARTRAEIEHAIDEWGFQGVGEIGGCDVLTPEWEVVYDTCVEKRIPVLVHVGIPLPSMLLKYSHPFCLTSLPIAIVRYQLSQLM